MGRIYGKHSLGLEVFASFVCPDFWLPIHFIVCRISAGTIFVFLAIRKEDVKPAWINKERRTHQTQRESMSENVDVNSQKSKVRIAVFASGAGSNAEKLIHYFKDSELATVALVVCNKPEAGVITIAQREAVPVLLIEKEQFFRGDGYVPQLKQQGIDFVVLAGFLWKIPQTLITAYPKRIVNIHPALLPKFGGKGMYGQYVHEAVLNAGEMESGITIHFVDEHYDNGDIIFQTACPILPGDKPGDIAQRIHHLEHAYYPKVIGDLLKEL
jgi:phosphoribosylglycinamide formyltransferase 1